MTYKRTGQDDKEKIKILILNRLSCRRSLIAEEKMYRVADPGIEARGRAARSSRFVCQTRPRASRPQAIDADPLEPDAAP